jgi:hypothetical protein
MTVEQPLVFNGRSIPIECFEIGAPRFSPSSDYPGGLAKQLSAGLRSWKSNNAGDVRPCSHVAFALATRSGSWT